jgi:deleted-in-malignant-brain-tumors protein 1
MRPHASLVCQELLLSHHFVFLADIVGARLANGTNSTSGRLEVLRDGSWGTVCYDSFDDTAARVACRQLGLSGGRVVYQSSAGSFGPGPESLKILMDNTVCTGSEAGLGQCNYTSDHNCKHAHDIGIACDQGECLLTDVPPAWAGRLLCANQLKT